MVGRLKGGFTPCRYFKEIPNAEMIDEYLYQKHDCCLPYEKLKEEAEHLRKAYGAKYRIKSGWSDSKHHLILWIDFDRKR